MLERNKRKTRVGTVVSDKMDKTVVVSVRRQTMHPKYGRILRSTKKYTAHDETDQVKAGDIVAIIETRPLSRTKRWRVERVVTKAR